MRLWSSWRVRRARLALSLEIPSSSSARSGLTSSAAAVGVGARRSAAKSAMVKSVSWPMPVTTGTGHARAIRACPVPVVTGIGHETDFTIADFAADRRAPTPTAAAELVSPERAELLEGISRLTASLTLRTRQELQRRMQHVDHLARRLVHPGARLRAQAELLGQLRSRLGQAASRISAEGRWKVARLLQRAQAGLPNTDKLLATSLQLVARLRTAMHTTLERAGSAYARRSASLSHLDPAAVLERGYSVVRDRSGRVVLRSASLAAGDLLDITFAEGGAEARVERSR